MAVTVAATRTEGLYLGRYTTVMDAKKAGIMLAWGGGGAGSSLG